MKKLSLLLLLFVSLAGFSQSESPEHQLLHYWDDYNFENPKIFVEGDSVLGYFYLMNICSYETSAASIKSTLQKASKDDRIFSLFIDTFRVYLFNPDSYFCDYERYLAICEFVINDENINKYAKNDFFIEKEIIETNRVGKRAANFSVYDKKDNRIKLYDIKSEYLVVFFNNPDCGICMKTKENLENSTTVNSLVDSGRLKIFAVCPYDEYELWENTSYPEKWLNGFDKDMKINTEKLYYFLESSSIYLLDKDKNIVKKDVRFDVLEEYLEKLM